METDADMIMSNRVAVVEAAQQSSTRTEPRQRQRRDPLHQQTLPRLAKNHSC